MVTNIEERISRLEGGSEHLATKADIERLNGRVESANDNAERLRIETAANIEGLRSEMNANIACLLYTSPSPRD